MEKIIKMGFLSVLSLLLVGCQPETSDIPFTQLQSHKVVIYGDSRTGNDIHQQLVNLMLDKQPDVVFHDGDMVEDGTNPDDWQTFDGITRKLQDSTEFHPCLGNHENESPLYFAYFGIPESMRWYSVDRFGIHFTVLDSNWQIGSDSEQYNWLVNDLGSSKSDLNIVILHHPLYSVCRNDPYYNQLRSTLIPLFQQNNVRIVFSGHEHNYERFYDNGIYYVVTGGGGAPLYDQESSSPLLQRFDMQHHFCLLTYDGSTLGVKVYDNRNQEIDSFTIPVH